MPFAVLADMQEKLGRLLHRLNHDCVAEADELALFPRAKARDNSEPRVFGPIVRMSEARLQRRRVLNCDLLLELQVVACGVLKLVHTSEEGRLASL